jgi:hypothetical protein
MWSMRVESFGLNDLYVSLICNKFYLFNWDLSKPRKRGTFSNPFHGGIRVSNDVSVAGGSSLQTLSSRKPILYLEHSF